MFELTLDGLEKAVQHLMAKTLRALQKHEKWFVSGESNVFSLLQEEQSRFDIHHHES